MTILYEIVEHVGDDDETKIRCWRVESESPKRLKAVKLKQDGSTLTGPIQFCKPEPKDHPSLAAKSSDFFHRLWKTEEDAISYIFRKYNSQLSRDIQALESEKQRTADSLRSLRNLLGDRFEVPEELVELRKFVSSPNPSLTFSFFINDIGYQCDVTQEGQPLASVCRSFGGSYETPEEQTKIVQDLYERIVEAVDEWRGAL